MTKGRVTIRFLGDRIPIGPNPHAKALRLGIYQGKKVPSKKGKGSYRRSRAHGPIDG